MSHLDYTSRIISSQSSPPKGHDLRSAVVVKGVGCPVCCSTALRRNRWGRKLSTALPMKNGDLPMKNGDLPMKNGDLPMKNGDVPKKNGDFHGI